MSDAHLPRTAAHEAGHAVAAVLFGFDVDLVSIKPAEHFLGVMIASPRSPSTTVETLGRRGGQSLLARWGAVPSPMFGSAFSEGCKAIMVALAGPVAEMLAPVDAAGHYIDGVDERTALATAGELTASQAAQLVEADREPSPTDDDRAYADAMSIGGPAAAGALTNWLGHETRRFVLSELVSRLVGEVADELLAHEVIDGAVVHALVRREEDRLSLAGSTR